MSIRWKMPIRWMCLYDRRWLHDGCTYSMNVIRVRVFTSIFDMWFARGYFSICFVKWRVSLRRIWWLEPNLGLRYAETIRLFRHLQHISRHEGRIVLTAALPGGNGKSAKVHWSASSNIHNTLKAPQVSIRFQECDKARKAILVTYMNYGQ